LQNRREIAAHIKVAGLMGILVLLSTVAEAFYLHHSAEVSQIPSSSSR